jgi:D-serine deaminase-like pyridoxal phosphate-dependent protein
MGAPELVAAIAGCELPAVVVDLDAFDRNADRIEAELAAGAGARPLRLRVATKSLRVPALLRRLLARGPRFQGLMCYSATEAAFLAEQGFDDLLVAYPDLSVARLRGLVRAHESGRRIYQVVDDPAHLAALVEAGASSARPFPVVVEVDAALRYASGRLHIGARRSPIRTAAALTEFLRAVAGRPGLRAAGIMVYESQVAGLPDRNPWTRALNPVLHWIRLRSAARIAELRERLAEAFTREMGAKPEIFNGGGSGSLSFAARETCLTEVTAGSAFLDSHLFDYYSNLRLEPALHFALPVVRRPDPGWVTCLSGGYVSSGKPGWDKVPLPVWPAGAALSPDEGTGEVQTPLRLPAGSEPALGSAVLLRPSKAGEIAERFTEYLCVAGGRVVDRAPTYRGLGQCFP